MSAGRVVLVTGSSRGLGRALVEHRLAVGDIVHGLSRGESTVEHPHYHHNRGDVTDERAVREWIGAAKREHGGVDAIINNAGIASMNHSLLTPLASVERMAQVNFVGTFLCCREAAKAMRGRPGARIVNFASIAHRARVEGEAVYAATKAAVVSLTEVLAREFGPLGITVNAVAPTPIATDLIEGVPKEKIAALIARQAIPRAGEPRDVLHVVDFFLHPDSDFVTGQTLHLGGW